MQRKTKHKQNGGFTIIEALIVMAIIASVVTGGILKQRESVQRKKAERAALEIKQAIEKTKDYALTGETVSGVVPELFTFHLSGGDYSTRYTTGATTGTYISTKSAPYKSELSISNADISFSIPNGERSSCSVNPCEITICGDSGCSSDSLKYTISITENSIGFK